MRGVSIRTGTATVKAKKRVLPGQIGRKTALNMVLELNSGFGFSDAQKTADDSDCYRGQINGACEPVAP